MMTFDRAAQCRAIAASGGAARLAKYGTVLDRIRKDAGGCWFVDTQRGRPQVTINGRHRRVVHVLYERERGPIPPGAALDHVACNNLRCVNPWHVEPRTQVETLRGNSPHARNARASQCKHGHSLSDAYRTRSGHRACRPCTLERNRQARRRKMEAQHV